MTKKTFILSFVCGIWVFLPTNMAIAQSNAKEIGTPFTLLLENVRANARGLAAQSEGGGNFNNNASRKSLTTISNRRLKAGIRATEFSDNKGGRIAIAGLDGVSDAKSDLIEYQIAARSKHAKNLMSSLANSYGKPDNIQDGMSIWYLQNPDKQPGQAKIITLSAQEVSGKLTIIANRTPISRRGELAVKPQRKLPQKTQKLKANASEKPRVQTKRVEQKF